MRSHIGWRGEAFFIRVWKSLPSIHVLKTLRESSKKTISASGGIGLLQMVSEPDTVRCASEDAESRRGVDTGWCANEDNGPRREVDCEIPHRMERGTKETSP